MGRSASGGSTRQRCGRGRIPAAILSVLRIQGMNQDLSILQLVLGASLVVQLVMLLLLLVSVTSWAAIFRKLFACAA
jgi:hypothetical protein